MAAAAAEIRYVAAKPLLVEVDGERVRLEPGDEIPNPEEWGRSLEANLEGGRIVALSIPGADELVELAEVYGVLERLSDEQLLGEIARRGLKPTEE